MEKKLQQFGFGAARWFAAVGATALLLSQAVSAEVVEIVAAKDNTLYEHRDGALSNGAGKHFFAGRAGIMGGELIRRGLVAFDVADAVPRGSTIISVELTMHMSRTIVGSKAVSLHRVLAEWGEGISRAPSGEGKGAPAAPGDATWIHTFFDSQFWAKAGGDFSPDPSAETQVVGIGFYAWGSTDQMVADVQNWLDEPEMDHGWLLKGDESTPETSKRFDTRENVTPEFRPLLVVEFTPPACNGSEKIIKAKCKTKRGRVKKVIVVVKKGAPKQGYTARLDTGEELTKPAKNNGKVKFTFKGDNAPGCRPNGVNVCGHHKDFDCSC